MILYVLSFEYGQPVTATQYQNVFQKFLKKFLKMLDIFSKKLHSLANPPDETKSKKNPAANTAGHKTLFSIILML